MNPIIDEIPLLFLVPLLLNLKQNAMSIGFSIIQLALLNTTFKDGGK